MKNDQPITADTSGIGSIVSHSGFPSGSYVGDSSRKQITLKGLPNNRLLNLYFFIEFDYWKGTFSCVPNTTVSLKVRGATDTTICPKTTTDLSKPTPFRSKEDRLTFIFEGADDSFKGFRITYNGECQLCTLLNLLIQIVAISKLFRNRTDYNYLQTKSKYSTLFTILI